MDQTKAFYDFCVPYNSDEKVMHSILKELVELGYKTIAIEQTFDHGKKETHNRASDVFPEPHKMDHLQKEFKNQIKILQRLTIVYIDASVTHAMTNSLNLKKYNIIAGKPKTDAALTHCCTTFNGDLVTFDHEGGARLMVNRKAFQVAVKRGMFFEIKYAPAIIDSNNRKDMIRIAHNYCVRGKSKNIVFSSGATNPFELRGPYDVANLAFIFGLSESQGKNAIDKFCRQMFLRAESRRLGKTIMFVKASGPIVFSDSSDDEEMDSDMEADEVNAFSAGLNDDDNDDDDDDDDDEVTSSEENQEYSEQPNKKKRIC